MKWPVELQKKAFIYKYNYKNILNNAKNHLYFFGGYGAFAWQIQVLGFTPNNENNNDDNKCF